MNDYYSVRIDVDPCTSDITDLIAAFLADEGFESFEPDSSGLIAYIPYGDINVEKIVKRTLDDFPLECIFNIEASFIKGKDWNEEWEKNYFKPILIDDCCVVHSSFHTDVPNAEYDIVIDPKMAFGTGHHDTTSQMVKHLLELPMSKKSVIDMGTGTGILGILAVMRGASEVTGIEIDASAYENAKENVRLNNVNMNLIHGDASALESLSPVDYFIANINRNIILNDIEKYARLLKKDGIMLLSGFYEEDIPMIEESASHLGLVIIEKFISNKWVALRLKAV